MRASTSFRIPLAADAHGRLVAPEEAIKGRRYRCPSCDGPVDLHAGERKRRHFHHQSASCSEETVLHLSAKRLIVEAVTAWRRGADAPVFVRCCAEPGCEATTRQPMPKKVLRAAPELRVPSGHVVDVGLVGLADLPIAAIEVLVSHEVDERKAFELGLPWVEVDAADVCASRGRVLTPLRDRFLPWLCDEHTERRGMAAREEREERKTRAALVRALPWSLDEHPGYRIEGIARCAKGHDMLDLAWDGREPPWPRPPNVVACENEEDVVFDGAQRRMRKVMAFRRSWAVTCPRCGARKA